MTMSFFVFIEAVAQRCSIKKVLLEIPQNSEENTCTRVSFLIKLQAWCLNFAIFLRTSCLKSTSHRCFYFQTFIFIKSSVIDFDRVLPLTFWPLGGNWKVRHYKRKLLQKTILILVCSYEIKIKIILPRTFQNILLSFPEKWRSGVFIVNFEQISFIVMVFPLLTLNKKNLG